MKYQARIRNISVSKVSFFFFRFKFGKILTILINKIFFDVATREKLGNIGKYLENVERRELFLFCV